MLVASASFTPAASAHGALDVVGAATTFAFRTPATTGSLLREMIMVRSASIIVVQGGALATDWAVHFYSVTPPSAQADDAVFDISSADAAVYLGKLLTGTTVDIGATQYVNTNNINFPLMLTGGLVYARLVNVSAVTTTAVAHTVTLFGESMS